MTAETAQPSFWDEYDRQVILRDQHERPMIIPPDGGKPEPYTRVSTLADSIKDAGGLIRYKTRYTALGIARHEDLAAVAAGCEYGDKTLDEIIEAAQDRVGGYAKANYGTAIHRFTEPDAPNYVPARMTADVAAYFAELDRHGARVLVSSRFIVNDALKVAGTFDDIIAFPGHVNRMSDKKTGTLHMLEHAIQLAAYHGGVYYELDADGNPVRTPLPDLDPKTAILAHIPAAEGECTLYAVDLDLGRAACELAVEIRSWRRRKDLAKPLEINDPKRSAIAYAIQIAPTTRRLEELWRVNQAHWNDDLNAMAAVRRRELETR